MIPCGFASLVSPIVSHEPDETSDNKSISNNVVILPIQKTPTEYIAMLPSNGVESTGGASSSEELYSVCL